MKSREEFLYVAFCINFHRDLSRFGTKCGSALSYWDLTSSSKVFWLAERRYSLRKTVEKVSPILVTLMPCSDSDFERSNVNLKENKPDGVNPNSNDIEYYIRKNEGKILWFSADWI